MSNVIRMALALVIVALSAFFSYQAPHSSTPAVAHEQSKKVAAAKDVESQDERVVEVAKSAKATLPASHSPIDFKHIIGADYKRHTGEPTGGHTLLNGDVRVIEGTASAPDASGVYRAQVQMVDPQHPGQWITKTDRNGNPMPNTMGPPTLPKLGNAMACCGLRPQFNTPYKVLAVKWMIMAPPGLPRLATNSPVALSNTNKGDIDERGRLLGCTRLATTRPCASRGTKLKSVSSLLSKKPLTI